MNVTVEISPSEDLRNLLLRAREFPERLLDAVGKGLNAAGPIIVGNAVKYRFTSERGPFPVGESKLGRVTGRLRQSISNTKPQIDPSSGEITMGFGSNVGGLGGGAAPVKYFGIHEFGFSGSVNVKAHTRRGKPVRSHGRRVNFAARAPMQTELRETRTSEEIIKQIERRIQAMLRELEGGPA